MYQHGGKRSYGGHDDTLQVTPRGKTHLHKSFDEGKEGDGDSVLPSGLLNLDQQVTVVACLHPLSARRIGYQCMLAPTLNLDVFARFKGFFC